jgi:outer membrane protein TolC
LLAARRGAVGLAQRAYHIATVRYGSGIATQLEVSDARLQLQTSEVNEVQAAKDYRIALAGLELAVGAPLTVSPKPLDQISARLPDEDARP